MDAAWPAMSDRDLTEQEIRADQCLAESQKLIAEIHAGKTVANSVMIRTRWIMSESRAIMQELNKIL